MKPKQLIICLFSLFSLTASWPAAANSVLCPFVFSFQDDGQVKPNHTKVVMPGEELVELSRSDDYFKYKVYLLKSSRQLRVDPDDIDSAVEPFKHALNYPIESLPRALSTFEAKRGDFLKKLGALACYAGSCMAAVYAGADFFGDQLHPWKDLFLALIGVNVGYVADRYIAKKEKVDVVAAVQAHAKFMWKTFLKQHEEKEVVYAALEETGLEYVTFEGDPTLTVFIVVHDGLDAHVSALENLGFRFTRRIARD